ncbi:MAG TPA: serine/threonine-protein kinase [Silvibacterium sp.]|nr:serine/threonine-protein kinase [Silvibacterium sp.]
MNALLDEVDKPTNLLEQPVFEAAQGVVAESNRDAIDPGTRIGQYEIISLLATGGMGEVWLAEQKQPVRRRIALKLIKAGMDTREVVARFESERQALALMDHPAIAKVFDAGSTPEGRPYFAMEYVPGIPITAYCDKHKLTVRQRMELFILVCEGVQHAHQKAIIHRDLKPSNILVTEVDGKPMPRIIDFGVAKATSQKLTAGTMYTRLGTMIGTLGYMSPEQADPLVEDVDTRTDVYSLGAVLYELLTGALPLDLRKLAFDEVLRRLRDHDTPPPSTKLRTLGDESAITAQNRGADPPALARQLRGDPDAIALKALEKDRARRYPSASGLAADIGRYLRNEPVTAQPPTVGYRARKYIRRHRLGVAVAAAGVLLLAAFAIAQAVQLRRITLERDRADRITQFMTGMFKVPDPSESRGNSVTAREILDKASKEINTSLQNDPELQAKMMHTMGDTYWDLGLYSRAQPLFERALEIQRRVLGPRHPDTLASMQALAAVLEFEGHRAEAEKLDRETLDIQRQVLGPENRQTLVTMNNLAGTLRDENRYAEAERLLRETLDIEHRLPGPENMDTFNSARSLAFTLKSEGRYSEAEKLFRETLDKERRILGPENPNTLALMDTLAHTLTDEERYPEAEKLDRQTLDIQRRVIGPEHPNTLLTMTQLAWTLLEEHRYAEAEKLFQETVDIQRRVLGPQHPSTLNSLELEAADISREGRYEDAEKLFREAIQTAGKANQPDVLAAAWYNFACGAAFAGRHDEALRYLDQAIDHGTPPDTIPTDPDLKSLHGDPRFDALVAKARQNATVKTH